MANRRQEPLFQYVLKNYSLTIVLLTLFLGSWIAQFVFQMMEFRNEAHEHEQSFRFIEFLPAFGSSTMENWQSEFLQLLTFVALTSFLIHRGSPESKDGDDEMKEKLEEISRELRSLRAERERSPDRDRTSLGAKR
jgi:hypothetical protein